ncbi:MAG: alpha/beta fold hydrolase [Bacteroidota bacterium]|nr:alpha/beta fold hydrolase [Bacteroidota bacterium]
MKARNLTSILLWSAVIFGLVIMSCAQKQTANTATAEKPDVNSKQPIFKTINFISADSLTITADLYMTKDEQAPFIILFHQAMFSRGSYREIAPKLNQLGFNCLAVDQRSGNRSRGVINLTHKAAKKSHLKTKYADAYPDLEAALNFVKESYNSETLLVWGSSYSAALVFVLTADYPSSIDGVLAFSPGEYFSFRGQKIEDFSAKVNCPVFITSAKSEKKDWISIFNKTAGKEKTGFVPQVEGQHGSKALWSKNFGYESYWEAVNKFLEQF